MNLLEKSASEDVVVYSHPSTIICPEEKGVICMCSYDSTY